MGQHVLVIDDDPTASDVVRRYLQRAGLDVTLSAGGAEALEAAAARRPDLVVLGLLPGMDGPEVCRRHTGGRDGTGGWMAVTDACGGIPRA